MPSCSSSTPSSCSRSSGRGRPRLSLAAAVALLLLLAGCGDDEGAGPRTEGSAPEPGGELSIAVDGRIRTIDPLLASTRAERIASRQVYEPLASRQNGPFGQTRRLPGLARRIKSDDDSTLWSVWLREGVSFADGEPLDADAVKANAARWMSAGVLAGLSFVDSPRPGLVRFFLDRPDAGFGRDLAQPRLGLVAPGAISSGAAGIAAGEWGTGPFELRERDGLDAVLARNAGWWGAPLGLGPGVDQIVLHGSGSAALRAEQLESGQVRVAYGLDGEGAEEVADDPLLTTVAGREGAVGVERSVRGLDVAAASQPLADVWLSDLG